ncbi:MATH and LRR domain-containing protein PFE0570w-like [Daktulosphaira vitifoliae]|uniref:MATH and LRR domain-containing protein PFE0570w-like n=1 Tax=Daktulosphaira vitifoliae TaxID=58002 RepID=UPI0021AA13BB|nr:MATH and LRR domain-containing protein PFE0570w-like [Daktulosphaira vitifoliae]
MMNMKYFVYIFFPFMFLNNDYFVNCKIKSSEYKKYVIDVVRHFCSQQGWILMPHIWAKDEYLHGKPIHEFFKNKATCTNYIQILNIVICSLNIRYTEILSYFLIMINYIIDKCSIYLRKLNTTNFNNCSILLYDAVKMSAILFSKLLDAMLFMSHINLKKIRYNMECLATITDYIRPFSDFTNLKMNQNPSGLLRDNDQDIFHEFKHIKNFFKNIKKTINLHELIKNHSMYLSVSKNHVPQYLKILYEEESFNTFKNSNLDVSVIKNLLINFYDQTIKNNYENIGFNELLDPNNSKFWLPQDREEEIITFLNSIIKKKGWSNLNHITLIEKKNYINVHDIVGLVNRDNHLTKRKYLSKFMRCRYTEIIQYFNGMLKSLIDICINEQNNNDTTSFIHCVIQLYNIINRSINMFDRLSSALSTIRKTTNDMTIKNYKLIIEKFINNVYKFISDELLKIYPSEKVFIDLNDTNNKVMANEYLIQISNFRSKIIVANLIIIDKCNSRDCLIEKRPSELNDMINFERDKNHLSSSDQIELICAKLNNFYENVILNDCEYLGF